MADGNNHIGALLLRAATGDASELPRALLELGVRVASAAVSLAAAAGRPARSPPLGLVAGLGTVRVMAAWMELWVSGEPRAAGKAAPYAAVVPALAVADGLRHGFAGNA